MRKLAVLAIVGLLAAPAMAGPTAATPLPVGTQVQYTDYSGGLRGIPIYADLVTSGFYFNVGSLASYPLPVGDDLHATGAGTLTSFTIGYFTPQTATFSLDVRFYANTASDGIVPPFPPSGAIATITVPGLPGGANVVAGLPVSIPVGADFWIEADYGTAAANIGPLLTLNSGGTVGYSHNGFSQTGAIWGLGPGNWADFVLAANVVPEPTTIGLMAIGGLLALRRRK